MSHGFDINTGRIDPWSSCPRLDELTLPRCDVLTFVPRAPRESPRTDAADSLDPLEPSRLTSSCRS
jgi:hypothetical protein